MPENNCHNVQSKPKCKTTFRNSHEVFQSNHIWHADVINFHAATKLTHGVLAKRTKLNAMLHDVII